MGDKLLIDAVRGKTNVVFMAAASKYLPTHSFYAASQLAVNSTEGAIESPGAYMPLPGLMTNGALASFSSLYVNREGYYDKMPTLMRVADHTYPATPLALALMFLDIPKDRLKAAEGTLKLGEVAVATDEDGQFKIAFLHSFKSFTYDDIVGKKVPAKAIERRIVMLGALFTGAQDFLPTRYNPRLQGTEFAAHATQTLIDRLRNEGRKGQR